MNTSAFSSLRLAITAAATTVLLAACGLAETTTVAATEAATAAEQAKQGKELEEKITRDIAAAQQTEANARDKVDAQSQ